jgi:hypothetical protein
VSAENVAEKCRVRFDLGTRQEVSFFSEARRCDFSIKQIDRVAQVVEEHYLNRYVGHIRELLRETLLASMGMASGLMTLDETYACVIKMLRVALWDGTVHALRGRSERVMRVHSFLNAFFYAGSFIIGGDNRSGLYVLTAPIVPETRLVLQRDSQTSL